MNILVTGGAGFIGSCFIRHILKTYPNYKIINLDALTYCTNIHNLDDIKSNPNYKFIHGNICNKTLVDDLTKMVDWVVNFAAESHVDNSIKNPEIFINTNLNGTLNLLEASRKNKIKKFLQISTDEVYGSIENNEYFKETTPLNPNNPYSASKAAADLLVRSYFKTYDLPTLNTRCSNNFGPYQYPEKLIPNIILKLLNNEKISLYGDGLNVRDWIYVFDHIRAIDIVLHKGKLGEVYNIGGNCEKTNLQIANIILKALNKDENLIIFIKDRPAHDRRYAMSTEKIENELGWKPMFSFDKSIKETIDWYITNKKWINTIFTNK